MNRFDMRRDSIISGQFILVSGAFRDVIELGVHDWTRWRHWPSLPSSKSQITTAQAQENYIVFVLGPEFVTQCTYISYIVISDHDLLMVAIVVIIIINHHHQLSSLIIINYHRHHHRHRCIIHMIIIMTATLRGLRPVVFSAFLP